MPLTINGNKPPFGSSGPGSPQAVKKNFERLSSGKRINSAGDDASGLAIGQSLEALTRSLTQAERNTNRGISLATVADGGLGQAAEITGRLRELAVQAADGALSETDRDVIDTEFQALKDELGRLSESTEFNGTELLAGAEQSINIQVGTGTQPQDTVALTVGGVTPSALGLDSASVAGADGSAASAALGAIDGAAQVISERRAELGAQINRFGSSERGIQEQRTSLTEANSRITDADIAEETSSLAKNQVLQRARIAVQAQANQSSSLALNLLQ